MKVIEVYLAWNCLPARDKNHNEKYFSLMSLNFTILLKKWIIEAKLMCKIYRAVLYGWGGGDRHFPPKFLKFHLIILLATLFTFCGQNFLNSSYSFVFHFYNSFSVFHFYFLSSRLYSTIMLSRHFKIDFGSNSLKIWISDRRFRYSPTLLNVGQRAYGKAQ